MRLCLIDRFQVLFVAVLIPGSDDPPADVLHPFLANGKDGALDVSVVNPLQQQLNGSYQGRRKGSPTCLQYQNGEIQ